MGAAWALGQIIYPILVSPLKFSDLQGTPIQAKKCLNLFDKASLIKLGTTFLKDDKASAILELPKYIESFYEKCGISNTENTLGTSSTIKTIKVQNPRIDTYIKKLQDQIQDNNDRARFLLGMIYREGILTKTNSEKAVKLLMEAANNNYPPAQHKLASMYYKGDAGEQSFEKSFLWEKKATEGNNPKVWNSLAFLYLAGLGCERDLHKALECYIKASNLGAKVRTDVLQKYILCFQIARLNFFIILKQPE